MTTFVPESLQSVVPLASIDPAVIQQIDPAAALPTGSETTPNPVMAVDPASSAEAVPADTAGETTAEIASEAEVQPAVEVQSEVEAQPEVATLPEAEAQQEPISADAATLPGTTEQVEVATLPEPQTQPEAQPDAASQPIEDLRTGALRGDPPALDKTTNILILGSDRRVGAPNWLTDVMMIVALDYENGRAGVISLPRDIYLSEIAGHNPNKLNVVDYLGEKDQEGGGGPALLGSIIQEHMGIRIDHYVRFDFRGFIALVDALDGVEVEIDCPYYDYFSIEDVILNVKPGIERLSGDEALVYVRSRKIGGDLDRARRQQRFVWAVRNQVLNENILPKLPALYNAVSESVQTDLGIVGTLRIARFAMDLDREDITGFVVGYPLVEQGWAGNMWVFRADWEAIRSEAQNVFTRDPFINTNTLAECP